MKPYKCRVHGETQNYRDYSTPEGGTDRQCRDCASTRAKRWNVEHPDASRARTYESSSRWRKSHPEYGAEYYAANRDRLIKKNNNERREIRRRVMAAYGGQCVCCSETQDAFLTIDHIRGDGYLTREADGGREFYKKLIADGFPKDRFRLLCMNCNWASRGGRACPHTFAHVLDLAV